MVIIKAMDKSTLKKKINYQSEISFALTCPI